MYVVDAGDNFYVSFFHSLPFLNWISYPLAKKIAQMLSLISQWRV